MQLRLLAPPLASGERASSPERALRSGPKREQNQVRYCYQRHKYLVVSFGSSGCMAEIDTYVQVVNFFWK